MLAAMCDARFAVLMVQRRHQTVGLIVSDVLRNIDLWLVDEGLEMSLPEGSAFATRYFAPDHFVMTAGVCIPLDFDLLANALDWAPQLLRESHAEAVQDRRFAEALYRAALAAGIMEVVTYRDPPGTGEST